MYRKFLLFISALALATPIVPAASTHKLATYNIRYTANPGQSTDTEGKDWGQRGPVCRDVILNYDLDIIGFQEITGDGRTYRNPITNRTQLEDLRAWLSDYELLAWDRDGTPRREYVAIAFKKSRYELLDQGSFFISSTPEKYSMGWDTHIESHPRVLGWVKLKDKESGQEFIYAATHTNDGWSLDGPYGSQVVTSQLKKIAGNLPVMVVADYNSNRVAVHARKGLKEYWASFHDAALDVPAAKNFSLPVTNRACTWTYNAFHPVSDTGYSGSEIDFQFYRGMNILERHIITEEFSYNGVNYPSSDHFPLYVVAELTPVEPKALYVDCNAGEGGDGSITSPFRTIGEAIARSDIDDTIHVAAGTYRESVKPLWTVSILGGYTDGFSKVGGRSIIDGKGLATPPIYASEPISLTLKDFTISGYTSTDTNLDGAVLFRGSNLRMENVVVEDNTGANFGGGLAVYNSSNAKYCEANNIELINCTFRNNSANYGAGVALGFYDRLDIDGCNFEGNSAAMSGAALYISFGTPEDNRIWFTEAKALITNCSFTANSSKRSGAVYISDEMPNVVVTIANSTFAGNTIDAKGGLPTIIKTYNGAALNAFLTDMPTDAPLSKVKNSKLYLGHVTMIGNQATCSSPANFIASALNVDHGEVKIVNSVIAGNYTNGTNAKADVTITQPERLTKETYNIFTSENSVNFTPDSKTRTAATYDDGVAAIQAMYSGELEDGKYVPAVAHPESEPTPFVPQKSTLFGTTETAILTVLNRNLEKEFSVDIDRDGSTGTQLKTDQLRRQRNSKSVPGAVEYCEEFSATETIADDIAGGEVTFSLLPDGRIRLSASRSLGNIRTIDLTGRLIASADIDASDGTIDLSDMRNGMYIITCLGNSFKIVK